MEDKREKVFFAPGDTVVLKQDIPNKPVMLVKYIDKSVFRDTDEKPILYGITCIWFTKDGFLQKERFSTKDLKHWK